jgi:hypothetical protein
MAEPLLDLLEELRAKAGHASPEQAVARLAAVLDGAPDGYRFTLHRWFAVRRSVAATAAERRFLDEVEALLLWSPAAPESESPDVAMARAS